MALNHIYLWSIFGIFVLFFLFGYFYRISIWLRGSDSATKKDKPDVSVCKKFFNYVSRFFKKIFSREFTGIFKSFFSDGMVHKNLFKDSILKWLIHIFMFLGTSAFAVLTLLHLIAVASAGGGPITEGVSWFIKVFGTIENRFTALALDLSKFAILLGALLAVIRFVLLKNKYKSVELKDKSAGIILSVLAILGFLYEAAYFNFMGTAPATAAFAPGGFILSLILSFIDTGWGLATHILFYIYVSAVLLFVTTIPYGKYSHMVFGPIVAVCNKLNSKEVGKV
ncbi:MAG: hypothetical protein R6U35_06395 [Candidatus Humimicrobiaceae bacterium]